MIYTLINPLIGKDIKLKTTYECETSQEAAMKAWKEITKAFAEKIPSYYFSLIDDNKKLYHYNVTETESSDDISFKIKRVNVPEKTNKKISLDLKRRRYKRSGELDVVKPIKYWEYSPLYGNIVYYSPIFRPSFFPSVISFLPIIF